jgi:predicted short-subunit dehydrogenase-like oxidoreductase (DUF2520 family)
MSRAPLRHLRTAGLISAGGVSQSFLVRLPSLLAGIGLVKAASFRVARRLSNSLRAGHAVEHYSDLEKCRLIWIAVPEAALDRVMHDLALHVTAAEKMVVLCSSNFDSLRPSPLRVAGACVGSLNALDPEARTLIAEGHPDVVRLLRKIAISDKRKLIEIRPAAKCLYLAGVHLSAHLVLPWIAAALESFRAAGFSRAEAAEAMVNLAGRSVRAYGKAGRKAWSATDASNLRTALDRDLEAIRAADARLAALYSAGIAQALRYFDGK